jgi:integrase
MGRIFKRGSIYWIAYNHRGKEYRESSHTDDESQAQKLLKKRLGEVASGKLFGPREERLRFDDLAEALITDYQANNRRSVAHVRGSITHLREFFGLDRVADITTARIKAYIAGRQKQGAANASINRELAALRRMFTLALQDERVRDSPHVPKLQEHNTRQGFIEHAEFKALLASLPEHLRDPIMFLYLSGWRVGEMRALEWRDVDLHGKVVRLRPEISKNKDGRLLPLSSELLKIIEEAYHGRRLDCPLVFHRDGEPIGDFRKAWAKACRAAGFAHILVHDLRRSAIRNMIRAGIPDRVAMALSGHKTRSIFDRYNIVSESDLAAATEKLQAHLAAQPSTPKVVEITRASREPHDDS